MGRFGTFLQRNRAARNTRRARPSRPSGPSVTYTRTGPLRSGYTRARTRVAARKFQGYRKRKNVKQVIKSQLGGLPSFSKLMLSHPPSARVKAMKRVGAENFLVENNATQLLVQEGFQNAMFYSWQNFDNCKQILSKVPGGVTPAAPKQFVFESTTAEFLITNSTLATMYVDVYDIIRKKDPGYYSDNVQDSDQNPTNNPLNAWKTGISDQIPTSPDMAAWQNINALPTDSRLFRDYFKVAKRSHVALSQGSTHRHHVMLRSNKLIDSEQVSRSNGDMAGLVVYTMIVAYGQPASIHSDAGAIVTTASGALDIVTATRQKYTFVVDNAVVWNVVDNLSTLTGEQVISTGAGAIVPNAYI